MRRIVPVLVTALFVAAGCEGCRFPFETTSQGTIRLSIHDVGAACSDSGVDNFDNGTPDDPTDDSTATWRHVPNSNICQLSTDWGGTLVAMANVREDVNEAVTEAGLDPATVQVEITEVTPTIDSVRLIDDVSGPDDPDVTDQLAAVISGYEACVGLGDTGCALDDPTTGVLRVTTDGGTVAAPATTVVDPQVLTDAANLALSDDVNVTGSGHAGAFANMQSDNGTPPVFTVPTALTDLAGPTLLITVTFAVNGDAIVGGPPAE